MQPQSNYSYYGDKEIDDVSVSDTISRSIDPGPWMVAFACVYAFGTLFILPILVILGQKWDKIRTNRYRSAKNDKDDDSATMDEEKKGGQPIREVIARPPKFPTSVLASNTPISEKNNDTGEDYTRGKMNYLYDDRSLQTRDTRTSFFSAHNHSLVGNIFAVGSRNKGKSRKMGLPYMLQRALKSEEQYMQAIKLHEGRGEGYINTTQSACVGKSNQSVLGMKARSVISDSLMHFQRKRKNILGGNRDVIKEYEAKINDFVPKDEVDAVLSPDDAVDANDFNVDEAAFIESIKEEDEGEVTLCCGPRRMCSIRILSESLGKLMDIAYTDTETKRIASLGAVFTTSEVVSALFDSVTVAQIGKYLGTEAITAYVVTGLLIGLTDEWLGGISSAANVVTAHAVGAGNPYLAGQYIQISAVMYILVGAPLLGMWCFIIEDGMRWMNMSDGTIVAGVAYTRVVVFHYLLEAIGDGCYALLNVTGYEKIGTFLDIMEGLVDLICCWVAMTQFKDMIDLATIGIIHLVIGAIFFVITFTLALWKGWLKPYLPGMLGSFALKNYRAVKNVFTTAVPLSIGSFLEYGEWEILTIFVAYLGPNEVAAWGILESVWGLFESAVSGIGEAAAIRTSYHLGNNDPVMGKKSAYKSLYLSIIFSFFLTSILYMCGDDMPGWFTSDQTLQNIMSDVVPLLGLGNLSMVFGTVSWYLIGSQGRYRLATFISMVCSWFITIPLAGFFSMVMSYDIKSIVTAIIVGSATDVMISSYVLLRSDWIKIAKLIHELNAESESESESE